MELITGYTGEAHVRAEDDALVNMLAVGAGVFTPYGSGSCVVIESSETTSGNSITFDISALINGRLVRTRTPETFTVTTLSGIHQRLDGFFIQIYKDSNNVEHCRIAKGSSSVVTSDTLYPNDAIPDYPANTTGIANVLIQFVRVYGSSVSYKYMVGGMERYKLVKTTTRDLKLIYNNGTTVDTDVETITEYRVDLYGKIRLHFGGINATVSTTANKIYGFEIPLNDSNFVTGQINGCIPNWDSQRTLALINSSYARIGLKSASNNSNVYISYWYISSLED